MRIYNSPDELIGRTPLIRLKKTEEKLGLKAKLLVKTEYFNPAGSVKDRAAKFILDDMENRGLIHEGSLIIEPTSGNTGVGLAALCAARGYRATIVMPSSMSRERQALIKAYGAKVVLTDGALGMAGAIAEAERLKALNPGALIAGQFTNPMNAKAHYMTTGPEIFEDTDGEVDVFVAGVGTGGTISGVGKFLKEKRPDTVIVAVEPEKSAVLSGGAASSHKIQGIGAGFVPEVLEKSVIDRVEKVSDEDAVKYARMLGIEEGLAVGISSGAALCAAIRLASMPENANKTVVALLPDGIDRYLSLDIFD